MYIPDKIRLVVTPSSVVVYADDDEGKINEPMAVSAVEIDWRLRSGYMVNVSFDRAVFRRYEGDEVTFTQSP